LLTGTVEILFRADPKWDQESLLAALGNPAIPPAIRLLRYHL